MKQSSALEVEASTTFSAHVFFFRYNNILKLLDTITFETLNCLFYDDCFLSFG